MEINGLPFHALVLHAAVVLAPLSVGLAVVFALVPRWRYLTRWPTAALTGAALVSVWLSRISGQAFLDSRPGLAPAVAVHAERGEQLSLLMSLFTVVVAVAAWGLGGRSRFASGAGDRRAPVAVLEKVLPAAVVVTALLVLVWTILTGDAGARAVWGG
jgi:hypothetical protein